MSDTSNVRNSASLSNSAGKLVNMLPRTERSDDYNDLLSVRSRGRPGRSQLFRFMIRVRVRVRVMVRVRVRIRVRDRLNPNPNRAMMNCLTVAADK